MQAGNHLEAGALGAEYRNIGICRGPACGTTLPRASISYIFLPPAIGPPAPRAPRSPNLRADGNPWDPSPSKRFLFTEKASLQLRVEAYRVLNHPVFAAPGATAGSSAFGTINATANRFRTLQLGARIVILSGSGCAGQIPACPAQEVAPIAQRARLFTLGRPARGAGGSNTSPRSRSLWRCLRPQLRRPTPKFGTCLSNRRVVGGVSRSRPGTLKS